VDNGVSLVNLSSGTTIEEWINKNESLREEFSVRCVINVENWTAWRLKDALSHNHCGWIYDGWPARNVEPATREIMIGRKQVRGLSPT